MEENAIKNDKQVFFNQVKGTVHEILEEETFSTISLSLGHENMRHAAFVYKTQEFEKYKSIIGLGDKVCIKFYLSSRKKYDRWYTTATVLEIAKI
jgi:hypothetical protein